MLELIHFSFTLFTQFLNLLPSSLNSTFDLLPFSSHFHVRPVRSCIRFFYKSTHNNNNSSSSSNKNHDNNDNDKRQTREPITLSPLHAIQQNHHRSNPSTPYQMSAAYLVQRQAAAAATPTPTTTTGDDDIYYGYGYGYEDDRLVPFWYTRTGLIVKWVVFLSLLVFFTAWVTLGYMHAKKRMQKGLAPLAYHRWLVPRAQLARVDPRYAYPPQTTNPNGPGYYRPGYQAQYDPSYNMQNMPPPPPMYDPSAPRPPMYEGPDGGSKAAPSQEYEAPPGPPPAQAQAQPVGRNDTGSSNPFRL